MRSNLSAIDIYHKRSEELNTAKQHLIRTIYILIFLIALAWLAVTLASIERGISISQMIERGIFGGEWFIVLFAVCHIFYAIHELIKYTALCKHHKKMCAIARRLNVANKSYLN